MAAIQATLELDSAEVKAGEEWSAAVEQSVVLGNNSACSQINYKWDVQSKRYNETNALITSVYGPINRYVKVSEDYLKV